MDARIVACTPLCREHVRIELAVPEFPVSQPGQFLELLCHETDTASSGSTSAGVSDPDFAARRPYLRRPYSLADRWTAADGTVRLAVISRSVGVGSRWLEHLPAGDTLNISGPLGHGFEIPEWNAVASQQSRGRLSEPPLVVIGGGVGIPPLLYLARRLHELGRRDVTAIFGATTRALLPLTLRNEPAADATPRACIELPGGPNYPALITSDDGSVGLRGLATDALRSWYDQRRRRATSLTGLVFACGPEGMLKAVARLTRTFGLECQLCIERNMACGIGTCLSCIVRARDVKRPTGWRWALACTDGPVFARDALFDYAEEPAVAT